MVTGNIVIDTTEIATQVAEVAAGIGSLVSGFKVIELAKDYYDLYRDQREYYYNVFQNGVEAPLASEVNQISPYNANYAARTASLYNQYTGPFGGAVTDGRGWWARHAAMYGDVPDEKITSYEADAARIKSDWTNYMFRFEEEWADTRNDIRWNRRLAVHNLGVKQGTAVAASLNSSLNEYQNHIADFSNQLATYGNGIAKYVGYKKGLADTADSFNNSSDRYNPKIPDNYVQIGVLT